VKALAVLIALALVSCTANRGGCREEDRYVGIWDTEPSYHYWDSVLELRGDGTFTISPLGIASPRRGTWAPNRGGVLLRIQYEEGRRLPCPAHEFLSLTGPGELDAKPVSPMGAVSYVRRPRPR